MLRGIFKGPLGYFSRLFKWPVLSAQKTWRIFKAKCVKCLYPKNMLSVVGMLMISFLGIVVMFSMLIFPSIHTVYALCARPCSRGILNREKTVPPSTGQGMFQHSRCLHKDSGQIPQQSLCRFFNVYLSCTYSFLRPLMLQSMM